MENQLPTLDDNQLPRLTIKEIQNETLMFFNLEKGLLFTFISLLKNPSGTIQTYLNSNRRMYTNPLSYILVGVAIYTVLFTVHPAFNKMMNSTNKMNAKNYERLEKDLDIKIAEPFEQAQAIYLNYQNVFYLLLIPAVGFVTFLLFEKPFNYAENLAINAYVFGTTTWFSVILTLLTFFIESVAVMFILTFVSYILIGYLYKKIFPRKYF